MGSNVEGNMMTSIPRILHCLSFRMMRHFSGGRWCYYFLYVQKWIPLKTTNKQYIIP